MTGAQPNDKMTAERILERGRTRRIKDVPYMGGTVYAHGFTRMEAKAYRRACDEAAGPGGTDALADERLVMFCIRDAAGKKLFGDEHLMRLNDMNEADFLPLFLAAMEVNGWGRVAEESLRKNSEPTRDDDSSSASPPTAAGESG